MTQHISKTNRFKKFTRDEDGAMTVWSIFLCMGTLLTAGVAIDVNNAVQSEVQLQGAADAAGHAALYHLYKTGQTEATKKAIEVAQLNMPKSLYGDVLISTDVEYGTWDFGTRTFNTGGTTNKSVRVTTQRADARSNAMATFLLGLVGYDTLELQATSVWSMDGGFCPPRSPGKSRGEGFFSLGAVDMQSANSYEDGFCIHGEQGVKVSTKNIFTDAHVSMAEYLNLQGPGDDTEKKPGDYLEVYDYNTDLDKAHFEQSYHDSLTAYFNTMEAKITAFAANPTATSDLIPDSLKINTAKGTNGVIDFSVANGKGKNGELLIPVVTTEESLDPDTTKVRLVKNAINIVTCTKGSNTIQLDKNTKVSDLVLLTNCDVKFLEGSSFENGSLITTSTTKNTSISAPNGTSIGSTGYCGTNGGNSDGRETFMMSMGDITFASDFEAYGLNLMSLGTIHKIAANANGLGGINVMAKGNIDVTSQSDFGFCGEGAPEVDIEPFFRMVG
ncbi:TadG family pilus assembly protein [Actibacterium pelagium]|uniref:Flp pilus-assembly TadE/G-like n=1 Tax=Actibacterium pelagium TaxID=2029103 RepID=A0A917ABG4_9RHOB|nr:TadG family pilus assembly protein [Actibacterium pelagium]GGE38530.1 hypothetical protein GCM10011517_02900 [Actibacterium pelagium]